MIKIDTNRAKHEEHADSYLTKSYVIGRYTSIEGKSIGINLVPMYMIE